MSDTLDLTLPSRRLMILFIARVAKKHGIMPEKATMGFGTWVKLAEDFTPSEMGLKDDKGRGFLDIAGIPFYADLETPEGEVSFHHQTEPGGRGQFDGLQYLEI